MNVVDSENYIDLTGEDEVTIVSSTNPKNTTPKATSTPILIEPDEDDQLRANLQSKSKPDKRIEKVSGEMVLNPYPAILRKKKLPVPLILKSQEKSPVPKKSPKIAVVKGLQSVSSVKTPDSTQKSPGEKEDIVAVADAIVKEVQHMLPFRVDEDALKKITEGQKDVLFMGNAKSPIQIPQTQPLVQSPVVEQVGTVRIVQRSTGLSKVVPLTRTPPPPPLVQTNSPTTSSPSAVDPNTADWITLFNRDLRKGSEKPISNSNSPLQDQNKQTLLVKPQTSGQTSPVSLRFNDDGAEAVRNIPNASASTYSPNSFLRKPVILQNKLICPPTQKFVIRASTPRAETVTSQNSGKALSDIIETAAAVAGISSEDVPESPKNNVVFLLCPVDAKKNSANPGLQKMLALVPSTEKNSKVPEKPKQVYKRLDDDLLPLPGVAKAKNNARKQNINLDKRLDDDLLPLSEITKTKNRQQNTNLDENIEEEITEENPVVETAILIKDSDIDDDVRVLEECQIQPSLIKPVDINEILNAGKKPKLPSRCYITLPKGNYCKGFGKNDTQTGFCQRFLPPYIKTEEAKIKNMRLKIRREYESNFISCGPVNSYFLPEIIKEEIEDLEDDYFKLPTLGEVVSQVTQEARTICEKASLNQGNSDTEKALKLIKKGLEMIQKSSGKMLEHNRIEIEQNTSQDAHFKMPTSLDKRKRHIDTNEVPPIQRKRIPEIQPSQQIEQFGDFDDNGDDLLVVRKIQIVRNPEQVRGKARGKGRRKGRGWSS